MHGIVKTDRQDVIPTRLIMNYAYKIFLTQQEVAECHILLQCELQVNWQVATLPLLLPCCTHHYASFKFAGTGCVFSLPWIWMFLSDLSMLLFHFTWLATLCPHLYTFSPTIPRNRFLHSRETTVLDSLAVQPVHLPPQLFLLNIHSPTNLHTADSFTHLIPVNHDRSLRYSVS